MTDALQDDAQTPAPGCAGGRLRAWLALLRVPNLFTVPGDPLAGFLLAASGRGDIVFARGLPCAGASLCLYAAGLLANDAFDLEEDRRRRPERPLPRGIVRPQHALGAAIALAALGTGLAALAGPLAAGVAVALAVLVVLYDAGGKRVPWWGPLNMGLCRGVSLLLGAAALGHGALAQPVVLVSAAGLTLYVAAVTRLAARETEAVYLGEARYAPLGVLVLWFPAVYLLRPLAAGDLVLAAALAALAVLWAWQCGAALDGTPPPAVVGRGIGRFLQGLLFIQMTLAATAAPAGLYVAAALLVAWRVAAHLARSFAQS
jgi:4-hydroxybenzoate polyprenyltransferase